MLYISLVVAQYSFDMSLAGTEQDILYVSESTMFYLLAKVALITRTLLLRGRFDQPARIHQRS
jgi:hypothetical protein